MCWDVLPEDQHLAKRTRGWWEHCQWSLSHNCTKTNNSPHQPGGTGLLCLNHVAHQASRPGEDPLGLGCWCWTRICGPNGFFLRIISMYCPCFSTGPLTTYQQQIRRLNQLQRFECPCKAILKDITTEIIAWKELGDHVMLPYGFQ